MTVTLVAATFPGSRAGLVGTYGSDDDVSPSIGTFLGRDSSAVFLCVWPSNPGVPVPRRLARSAPHAGARAPRTSPAAELSASSAAGALRAATMRFYGLGAQLHSS